MSILDVAAMFHWLGRSASNASIGYRNLGRRFIKKPTRRNPAGTKLQRKAEAGVLTMRAPGGVVSQLYRELQQRNFKQGANK